MKAAILAILIACTAIAGPASADSAHPFGGLFESQADKDHDALVASSKSCHDQYASGQRKTYLSLVQCLNAGFDLYARPYNDADLVNLYETTLIAVATKYDAGKISTVDRDQEVADVISRVTSEQKQRDAARQPNIVVVPGEPSGPVHCFGGINGNLVTASCF